jgi:DNA repair protein RadC
LDEDREHEDPDAWRSSLPEEPPRRPSSFRERREPASFGRRGGAHPSGDQREADSSFHGIGHRERVRDRLIEGGTDALADYEVLEFILFGGQRRGDTKPLAKTLIKRFGSLAGVLNADPTALFTVEGVTKQAVGVIKITQVAARRIAKAELRERPLLSSWNALIDYLSLDMAHLTRERVRVLYLDAKNRLVKDEHISEGTIDEASVHPREVIHHALDCGAAALILVHNHPSGSPEPSRADIELTHRIAEAGRLVGITVHDHVIVGKEGHVSLRAKGLI